MDCFASPPEAKESIPLPIIASQTTESTIASQTTESTPHPILPYHFCTGLRLRDPAGGLFDKHVWLWLGPRFSRGGPPCK